VTTIDLDQDYSVPCYSGATRMQSELTAAFNLVADKTNWKYPVNALVSMSADLGLISDAVVHFTGSVPTMSFLPMAVAVRADGYYRAIGS